MYTWMTLASAADLAQLDQHIDPEYAPQPVATKLSDGLSDAVKGILIERNYIDKDYRSTYYNFYAKKGRRYRPDCVRLHFFDETVSFDETALKLSVADGHLSHHYFGFMVLRPIGVGTIGRSVVTPDVRREAARCIITAEHKVHLLGHRLTIHGFPSMDQHIDISVCAHAACWSILKHYSERYGIYREYLTHDITLLAQQFDPGGLNPSNGLVLPEVERVFQAAGTFPVIVARNIRLTHVDRSFYRQLAAYVDSGFPLFAAMNNRNHAMAVIGYDWRPPLSTGVLSTRYSWDEIKALAVVDDNHLPYLPIPVAGPKSAMDINAFIVALPEKVFYPASAFDKLVPTMFNLGGKVDLPPQNETICRYFITTASAFRQFVRGHESEFDPRLVALVMKLPFAQFLWIVEFATEAQWAVGRVSARAIIDATASLTENYPYWIFHGLNKALIFARESGRVDSQANTAELPMADIGHSGFSRMDTNLRSTQTK